MSRECGKAPISQWKNRVARRDFFSANYDVSLGADNQKSSLSPMKAPILSNCFHAASSRNTNRLVNPENCFNIKCNYTKHRNDLTKSDHGENKKAGDKKMIKHIPHRPLG
jgi:hypothetical protein